jgi:hypothetical protein
LVRLFVCFSGYQSEGCAEFLDGGGSDWIKANIGLFIVAMAFIIAMPFVYIYFWIVVNSYRKKLIAEKYPVILVMQQAQPVFIVSNQLPMTTVQPVVPMGSVVTPQHVSQMPPEVQGYSAPGYVQEM